MKSKEEMIEVIAITLDSLEYESVGWQNSTESWKNTCRSKARAVLKAVCGDLPEMYPNIPKELLEGSVPLENRLPDMYYSQLKQWGEK